MSYYVRSTIMYYVLASHELQFLFCFDKVEYIKNMSSVSGYFLRFFEPLHFRRKIIMLYIYLIFGYRISITIILRTNSTHLKKINYITHFLSQVQHKFFHAIQFGLSSILEKFSQNCRLMLLCKRVKTFKQASKANSFLTTLYICVYHFNLAFFAITKIRVLKMTC